MDPCTSMARKLHWANPAGAGILLAGGQGQLASYSYPCLRTDSYPCHVEKGYTAILERKKARWEEWEKGENCRLESLGSGCMSSKPFVFRGDAMWDRDKGTIHASGQLEPSAGAGSVVWYGEQVLLSPGLESGHMRMGTGSICSFLPGRFWVLWHVTMF